MLHAILTVLALSSAPTEPLKPACHESRKTTIKHTKDGRVVIRTRTVLVCEHKGSK
jgi:hypothetical protein